MLTFKTQFPIHADNTTNDFMECIRIWITGSPHSGLAGALPESLTHGGSYKAGGDSLSCMLCNDERYALAGARYEKIEADNVAWTTDVIGSKDNSSGLFKVSIQLSVDSELPVEHLDQGRRPYVIKTIMENLGGGKDGNLQVSDIPLTLTDNDLAIAADLICGKSGVSLPVVYVSSDNRNAPHVDAEQLSKWLSGMAHVVIEPNRAFSFRLMHEVYSENAYGGAVGIYWPDGVGKWIFLPNGKFEDPMRMQTAVAQKIRTSLLSQRAARECSWSYLRELHARQQIKELENSGSQDVKKYIEHFDTELAAKDDEIRRLESELARLRYSQQFRNEQSDGDGNTVLLSSSENDLYQAERIDMIIEAIRTAQTSAEPNSRRHDVLNDIVNNHRTSGERDDILDKLKTLLHQYTKMDAKTRAGLESLGFQISDEGKHYKLLFHGDTRYPFVLAKTGSDWRGGMNAYSDLKRRLF